MSDISRRDAVKLLTAGLACGGGAAAAADARDAKEDGTTFPTPPPADPHAEDTVLKHAIEHPQSYMFREEVSFQLHGDGYSRDLYITSARNSGKRGLRVPLGAMRIFHADPDVYDFTKQGGVYWKFFNSAGKFQFNKPGALVMIVRQRDDAVHCYRLGPDFRC